MSCLHIATSFLWLNGCDTIGHQQCPDQRRAFSDTRKWQPWFSEPRSHGFTMVSPCENSTLNYYDLFSLSSSCLKLQIKLVSRQLAGRLGFYSTFTTTDRPANKIVVISLLRNASDCEFYSQCGTQRIIYCCWSLNYSCAVQYCTRASV
jgi:hypothetical protein